jgi:predicted kinase
VLARPLAVFVLVAGPPGSGKSTLARPLAAELGLPLLVKDAVKEALIGAARRAAAAAVTANTAITAARS